MESHGNTQDVPPNEPRQGLERLCMARCLPTRALLLAFGCLQTAVSRFHQVFVICLGLMHNSSPKRVTGRLLGCVKG